MNLDFSVAERLETLIDQLRREIGLDADDRDFVGRVAEGVGLEIDLQRDGLTTMPRSFSPGSARLGRVAQDRQERR